MHRLLEGWAGGARAFAPAQLRRVAREFALDRRVGRRSRGHGAAHPCRRRRLGLGRRARVDWHGNEVPLHHQGELLRLDRLVRRAGTGEWWVLDYKAAARPEQQDGADRQLRRYRAAVQAAYPGAPVQAAFLTGQGGWWWCHDGRRSSAQAPPA